MQRQFVRLTAVNVVDGDLEFDGPDASIAPAPAGLLEVTGHPQWQGVGSLTGAQYDPGAQTFTVPAPVHRLPVIDFLRLFTPQERIAIRTAAAANNQLRDWYDLLTASVSVNLGHPEVLSGLASLQAAGLLTSQRVTQIAAGVAPTG